MTKAEIQAASKFWAVGPGKAVMEKWPVLRGWACGVPTAEIDLNFHLRRGYAQPCDRKTTEGQ